MQEQRSHWERSKNYFAPKTKSEIILPATAMQSLPSPETVHWTVSEFTPLRALDAFSGAPPPYPCDPFEKGSTENFYCLDKT